MASKRKKATAVSRSTGSEVDRVTFKYIFDDNYNPVYANGAYGGVTSQGEITVNFYVERQPLPFEESYAVRSDGKLGERVARQPEMIEGTVLKAIRFVTTGVIMKADVAHRVYEFLGRHLAHLESKTTPSTSEKRSNPQEESSSNTEEEQ